VRERGNDDEASGGGSERVGRHLISSSRSIGSLSSSALAKKKKNGPSTATATCMAMAHADWALQQRFRLSVVSSLFYPARAPLNRKPGVQSDTLCVYTRRRQSSLHIFRKKKQCSKTKYILFQPSLFSVASFRDGPRNLLNPGLMN